jgi:hypothetical protein
MHAPVAVVEIVGDENGWLSAGSAALASGPFRVMNLMPCGANELARMYAGIDAARRRRESVLIVCGDVVRDARHRPVAPVDAAVGPALVARIRQHSGVEAVALSVNPGACGDPAHATRVEQRDSRGTARAALRLARKATQGLLVTARRAPVENYRLTYGSTPLTEAVNTPRALGDRFVRPQRCTPTAALAEYLRPLVE